MLIFIPYMCWYYICVLTFDWPLIFTCLCSGLVMASHWMHEFIISRFTVLMSPEGSVHYDEGESEAESIHSSMDVSNPIFQLYEAVRGSRNSQGQLLAEPFFQLPSRKDYPNYFQQITHPISLQQIRYRHSSYCRLTGPLFLNVSN